jgi:hypothetical protein
MTKLKVAWLALWLAFGVPSVARADPITAFFVTIGLSAGAAAIATTIVINLALTVAISALQRAMMKKPVPPGIKIERTLTGGANSRTFIMGLYATAGSQAAPPMSHGQDGDTPNAYLTHIVALSDVAIDDLTGFILNGERVTFNKAVTETYGWPITATKYAGKCWIKFHDGRQTTADSMLTAKYSGYARPWTSARIGTGVAYAIVTYLFDQKRFQGEPEEKFEVQGISFYDPRLDTTVGGSGSHRLNDPTTWEPSVNTVVQIYNIKLGIPIGNGQTYGGDVPQADLPLANWVAGMNVCDESITTSAGTEPRYRSGYEVVVADDEPVDVIEELLKACSGAISEVGGVYRIRVGPPSLPVMFITDDDLLVSQPEDFDPINAIHQSRNAIYARFPHPVENWVVHDAPPLIDAGYLAADDDKEISADLQFPAVPYPLQVQRNMKAWLIDDRRARRHNFTLGPYGFRLEALDVVSWTSTRNGYVDKLFEVDNSARNLRTLNNSLAVREVDPSDYDFSVEDELPDPASVPVSPLPTAQGVPGWAVAASSVKDDDGEDRRPAGLFSWTATAARDATGLQIQVRTLAGSDLVSNLTVGPDVIAIGQTKITEGIVNDTSYEARAQYIIAGRDTLWSSWLTFTTGDIRLGPSDMGPVVFPDGTMPVYTYATFAALPVPPTPGQEVAYVTATGKLYRWDATLGTTNKWTASVPTTDLTGAVTSAQIVDAAVISSKIAAAAVLTANINDGAIVAAKIAANTITAAQIAANTITAAQIAALTITAAEIASNAITAVKINAGAVTTAKLAAGAVTANEIAAGAIITDKLDAGAVTAAKINVTNLAAISADLGTVTAGTLNVGSGGVVIRSATSGARITMSSAVMEVYDASNVRRVRIGVW